MNWKYNKLNGNWSGIRREWTIIGKQPILIAWNLGNIGKQLILRTLNPGNTQNQSSLGTLNRGNTGSNPF